MFTCVHVRDHIYTCVLIVCRYVHVLTVADGGKDSHFEEACTQNKLMSLCVGDKISPKLRIVYYIGTFLLALFSSTFRTGNPFQNF